MCAQLSGAGCAGKVKTIKGARRVAKSREKTWPPRRRRSVHIGRESFARDPLGISRATEETIIAPVALERAIAILIARPRSADVQDS